MTSLVPKFIDVMTIICPTALLGKNRENIGRDCSGVLNQNTASTGAHTPLNFGSVNSRV
jgi:hypothetical protein